MRYNNLPVKFFDIDEDWLGRKKTVPNGDIVFATDLMGKTFQDEAFVLEDACEAFGSRNEQRNMAGTLGRMGSFSFFPSHTISTGEGGAIITNDEDLARLCRAIRIHGTTNSDPMEKFHFPIFGYNGRMTTMQAVLGIALMEHVFEYIERRHVAFEVMNALLGGFPERHGEYIVPHAYPIEFVDEEHRDQAMRDLMADGIECRKFFSCIPASEPEYLDGNSYPVAERIAATHLYVPCHQNMSREDIDYVALVVDTLKGRA